MAGTTTSSIAWWEARRFRYNVGLVVVGIPAFIAYAIVCSTILPADAEVEITAVTIFLQGIGYLVMIGAANVCYSGGAISERIFRPADPGSYRQICYRVGFWFFVLLPFTIPAFPTFLAFFDPGYWRQ